MSVGNNKNQITLLDLLNNCIFVKSTTQILPIKDESFPKRFDQWVSEWVLFAIQVF